MPGSNVFPNPKAIVTASDRIAAKRDTTIYKELEENVVHHNTIATNKKLNNLNYQDNFYTKSCSNSPHLAAAKNYDLLLSVTKGKRYANPTLDGASSRAETTSQNGNHLRVVYNCSSNKVPVRKLTYSGCGPSITDPCVIGSSGPENDDLDNPWPRSRGTDPSRSAIPSYIIDPSYNIFYSTCEKNVSPWKGSDICDVSFQEMFSYWRAANAQPLSGISFPEKVVFKQQNPTPFTETFPYPPRPSPVNPSDGSSKLHESWCNNNKLI